MKRLLLVGVGALMLSACGSSGSGAAVSANSANSTEITAVGTIIGNVNSNASAPPDNATADTVTTANTATVATDNSVVSQGAVDTGGTDDAAVASNDSGH